MNAKDWMESAEQVIANTYARFPIVLTSGNGCTLKDAEGRSYTDFVAGIAVCNLGHSHEAIAQAISEQARRLIHVSNLYYTQPQIELALWLTKNSFADKAFFCNSGAEANEAAIKLARKYFKGKGAPERYRIITMEGSFHGRTMATLSATGQDKVKKGFEPLLNGFDIVPFDDVNAVKAALTHETCAVMVEPVQGEGGVRCPSAGYLESLRELCNQEGLLLIFDEVQTGMGRTGDLFAYEHHGICPDIMTLAKALANGLPMGAMLSRAEVANAFVPGSHATTFGGGPLVATAALTVANELLIGGVLENCRNMGRYFKESLLALKSKHSVVLDVRGRGLLLGLALACDGASIVKACMENGFLINCTQGNVLRFIPPLIVKHEEIDRLISCLDTILGKEALATV